MTEFPAEVAIEQQTPVLPDDTEVEAVTHGDDVDPAQAYTNDRIVPVDEDEWH